jgi:hypothetical protein
MEATMKLKEFLELARLCDLDCALAAADHHVLLAELARVRLEKYHEKMTVRLVKEEITAIRQAQQKGPGTENARASQ